jgi:hypothetical protein
LAAALVVTPKAAFAAVPGTTAKLSTLTDTLTMYIGDTKGTVPTGAGVATGPSGVRNVWLAYTAKEGTVTNVNTTNYKVALAYAYPSEGKDHLWINAYKPGKTTLTFNYGKKKRTVKIVVKKYTNPINRPRSRHGEQLEDDCQRLESSLYVQLRRNRYAKQDDRRIVAPVFNAVNAGTRTFICATPDCDMLTPLVALPLA